MSTWIISTPKPYPGLAEASPHARFVVPLPIVEQVTALGIAPERVIGVQADEERDLGTVKLFPVPALHGLASPPAIYSFDFVERENQRLYRYLGYVVEIAGVRVYHAGDTLTYDGMVERLRKLDIDIALLPINGRSYFREQQDLVGNTDEREAADLAAAIGVKLLVPSGQMVDKMINTEVDQLVNNEINTEVNKGAGGILGDVEKLFDR